MVSDSPTKRISNVTVTKIFRNFTYKMAAKNGGHRYEAKLRHCQPMYTARRAEQLRGEVSELTAANSELKTQLETSQSRLIELSVELGQLRDDISCLRGQIQTKEQANGQNPAVSVLLHRIHKDLAFQSCKTSATADIVFVSYPPASERASNCQTVTHHKFPEFYLYKNASFHFFCSFCVPRQTQNGAFYGCGYYRTLRGSAMMEVEPEA